MEELPILSDWVHHSEEEEEEEEEEGMIPNELNITTMAQHPPKRSNNSVSTAAIISAMHHAVTRPQRLVALQTARAAFSHKNTDLHSREVDQGAIHALVLQLGYSDDGEIQHIIHHCLYSILSQCATRRRIAIWQELGAAELVPLLLVLQRRRQQQHQQQQQHQYGWAVLRLFCKLSVAKSSLIRHSGVLEQLVSLLVQEQPHPAFVGVLLGALKDLSFRSESIDKQILWNMPGLTEQLVAIAMGSSTAPTAINNGGIAFAVEGDHNRLISLHKEYIATFWWNLALQADLKGKMQSDSAVVSALQQLLQEPAVQIRRSAVAALGNLVSSSSSSSSSSSIAKDNSSSLLLHQNDAFWSMLEHLCLHEEDRDCRRRVVRTMRCLLSQTPKPATMHVLTQVARNDVDTDTRLQALEGLRYLQKTVAPNSWIEALVNIIEGAVADTRVAWMACQMMPPKTRELEPTDDFWTAISQVVESIPESHGRIIELMAFTAQNTGHDKIVSSPVALATLGKLISTERQAALNLLEELAAHDGRKRLAECDEVLSALVTLCLSTTGNDKDMAKGIILQLVPEL